jgi:hypothetical protein
MMRITHWHQFSNPPADTPPTAMVSAFNEFVQAAKKVPEAGDVRWGFGGGGVVTVGFPSNYAVADAILKDPGVQAAGLKVFMLGIGVVQDLFVTDPEQVMPFIPKQ